MEAIALEWVVQPLGELQCVSVPQAQGCSCLNCTCSCAPRKPISVPGWIWVDSSSWTYSALCFWDELKAIVRDFPATSLESQSVGDGGMWAVSPPILY